MARRLYAGRRLANANATKIELLFWSFLTALAIYGLPHLQGWLAADPSDKLMGSLQTFAVTVGGAMLGATAIASSFVLFATQVNVDRLPYGLFYRFSLDWKLLSAFALSFMAAIGGTALSLISKPNLAVLLIASELAAVILVLRLLLFAYRRALHLVNPVEQLQMIVAKAERNLRQIDRQIRWTSKPAPEGDEGKIDAARRAIFDASPRWYPRLFARRASEERALAIQRFELDPDGSGQRHVRRKSFAAERSF